MRDFASDDELRSFINRMGELADAEVSELILASRDKSQEARSALSNYENWRKIISENMNEHLEYTRINEEIKEVQAFIGEEVDSELKELESSLKATESRLSEKKEISGELQQLLGAVSVRLIDLCFI